MNKVDFEDYATRKVGLGKLLRRSDSLFNSALSRRLQKHGISFSEFQHLQNLWKEDGIKQSELSRRIGITAASSTSVLNSLQAKDLVDRHPDSDDGRSIRVFLTPAGAALKPDLSKHAVDVNLNAVQGMSPLEIHALYELLSRVIDNLAPLDE